MKSVLYLLCGIVYLACAQNLAAKSVAYIYGDVAEDGSIPSGAAAPFHQMLLTDTGNRGCSQFKAMVEGEGYTISQYYDQATTLNAAFLNPFDVVIFGLHQKVWPAAEQAALDTWLQAGGGIMMYSDSAAGGHYGQVGINNPTGQTAVNSILSNYGMQVTVDQGGGVRAYRPISNSDNPIIWNEPVFEGEGVSPVAIDPFGDAVALYPFDDTYKVAGSSISIDARNVTISNPEWAVMAYCPVGQGSVIATFDRQPMWNNGEGSDIDMRDNREILRRIVRYLARDYGNSSEWLDLTVNGLEMTYRQWSAGTGTVGYDYTARNNRFTILHKTNLVEGAWAADSNLTEWVSTTPETGGETEQATVRLLTDSGEPAGFARVAIFPATNAAAPSADAGMDTFTSAEGLAWLEGSVSGATTSYWTKVSGPGSVTFTDASDSMTTAAFSMPGSYELSLTSANGLEQDMDSLTVLVHAVSNIVHAINCGQTGGPYSAINGITYSTDAYFIGGGPDVFPGNAVARTGDDALYNYARSKNATFSGYAIPVPNGSYTVHLQFAETYWSGIDERVFDTELEGALVIDNLDLVAEGGIWVAYDRSFVVTVSDGTLNIDFTASENNPLLNAIVVVRN